MSEHQTQRNLVAGIIALDFQMISPEHLVTALRTWRTDKSQSLAEILVQAGHLDIGRRNHLESLLSQHLRQYADNPAECLAALSVSETLHDHLQELADPDITASLIHVRRSLLNVDPYATRAAPTDTDLAGTVIADLPQDPYQTVIGEEELQRTTSRLAEYQSRSAERYRVLRLHAKGGLGLVSVAEDSELHREVALKEIQRQHADNEASRARFLIEAEVTGRLEHPGIVPVYGLGQYADGRPYYAMRLIRGQSLRQAIDTFHQSADSGALDAGDQLLQLHKLLTGFIAVCNTIEYAHSRGILHRDIKPDNIMLGDYGETLVVDWGLAKALGQAEPALTAGQEPQLIPTSGSAGETLPGMAIGTPQYMPPEQAAGRLDELTPASDVYSLGATLYYLLTGSPPIDKGLTLQDVLRRVQNGDFISPRARRPKLSPALNAVCLKALALQPADRYPSARALAADLEHWLADEPVTVYHEPFTQRLARWSRRHRAAAQSAILALVVIAVVAITATGIIEGARKRELAAKVEATQRSQLAREVIDTLLTGIGQALENYPGMQEARKRLLQRAADDYLQLTDAASPDPELRAEAARAFGRLGDVRTLLNQLKEADAAYASAESMWRELTGKLPTRRGFQIELANCLTRRAIAAETNGQTATAEESYRNALQLLEPLQPDGSTEDFALTDALGTVLVNLGRLQGHQGHPQEAETTLRRALKVFEQLGEAEPRPRLRLAQAAARDGIGTFLAASGREVEAIPEFERAIQLYGKLVAEHPGEAEYLSARAASRLNLAASLRDAGRSEDEVLTYRRVVEDYGILLAALPDVPRYRENLAVTRTNLAQGLHKLGQNPAALVELEKSLEEMDLLSAEFPTVPSYLEGLATTRATMASVLRELAQYEPAREAAQFAVLHYGQLVEALPDIPRYRAGLGIAHSQRARILVQLKSLDEAEQEFDKAIHILQEAVQKSPAVPHYRDSLAAAWLQRAWSWQAAGNSSECRQAQQEALQLWQSLVTEFPQTARFADNLAWALATGPAEDLRDPARALQLATRATELVPLNDFFWRTLGAAQLALGDFATARQTLDKAARLRPSEIGAAVFLLATAEWRAGDQAAAREHYNSACAWSDQNKPGDSDLRRFRDALAQLLMPPPADAAPPPAP